MSAYPEECPNCHASLIGESILEHQRDSYAVKHFMRVIEIVDRNRGRATNWKCPDCGHEWPRR